MSIKGKAWKEQQDVAKSRIAHAILSTEQKNLKCVSKLMLSYSRSLEIDPRL